MGQSTRWSPVVAAALAVQMAGCGMFNVISCTKSGDGLKRTETIGTTGGTIVGPDDSMLDVPEGALEHSTDLTITQDPGDAPSIPDAFTPLGYVWSFQPHGQEFLIPVTLRVPAFDTVEETAQLYTAPRGGPWIRVRDARADGDAMTTQVDHLSFFVVAEPMVNCGDSVCGVTETPSGCPGDCGVVEMGLGFSHSCAVLEDGSLRCWGLGDSGQLGSGQLESQSTPMEVLEIVDAVDVDAGSVSTCAVDSAGDVWCFGQGAASDPGCLPGDVCPTPVPKEGASGRVAVEAGSAHYCVLSGVAASCWGANSFGQLGIGTNVDEPTPTMVDDLTSPVQLASLESTTCAVLDGATVSCWGHGGSGQLTTGEDSSVPVAIADLSSVADVAVGAQHVCVLLETGDVWCWGRNDLGQVGDVDTSDHLTPTGVVGLAEASAICAGYEHSCALTTAGGVACWGSNTSGQLGNGTFEDSYQPVEVTSITTATGLWCGQHHSCATLEDGTVLCWGLNDEGQLGNPETGYRSSEPVQVAF